MVLPGIVDLNGQFFIKVDDTAVLLANANSVEEAT